MSDQTEREKRERAARMGRARSFGELADRAFLVWLDRMGGVDGQRGADAAPSRGALAK